MTMNKISAERSEDVTDLRDAFKKHKNAENLQMRVKFGGGLNKRLKYIYWWNS
jgi:hypothetical protein